MTGVVAAIGGVGAGVVISAGPAGPFTSNDVGITITTVTYQADANLVIAADNGTTSDWMTPKLGEPAGNYEIRVTPTGGTFSGGSATGSWLALSSDRSWYVQRNTTGVKTCTATYEIRRASDSVVLSSVSRQVTAITE